MKFTLPFEGLNIKAGEAFMLHDPSGKEHYVKSVTYEHRQTKIVTVVEAVPYDEFDGPHRSEFEG